MSRNPSSILYDEYGSPVATLDGYNLVSTSPGYPVMLKDSSGNAAFLRADGNGYVYITAPILEAKDFATESTLIDAYNKLDSLEAKDFATETTQQTLATESTLIDAYNKLDSLEAKDFATETTLASIKDTDGIKKITDALPTGDNDIGRVKLIDAYSTQIPTIDGYTLEDNSPGIPVMGIDDNSYARFLNMLQDGNIFRLQTSTILTERSQQVVVADFYVENISATTYFIAIDLNNQGGSGPYKHTYSSGDWIYLTGVGGILLKEKPSDEWDGIIGIILRIDGTDADIGWLQFGAMHARDTGSFESTFLSERLDTPISLEVSGGDLTQVALGNVSYNDTNVNTTITLPDVKGNLITPSVGDVVGKAILFAGSGTVDVNYSITYYVE